MPKTIIITPTYNECENIEELIPALLSLSSSIHIVVIDDNSPDGTGDVIRRMAKDNPRIHGIYRRGKFGYGSAHKAGFAYAFAQDDVTNIIQMDADLSHNPRDVPKFIKALESNDVVIGSRYCDGGGVKNWPWHRRFLSSFANFYARVITGMPFRDVTGGFRGFRKTALQKIDLDKVQSNGYSFQIEMNFRSWKKGFSMTEIPIVFEERRVGASKLSKKVIFEAIWIVWWLRIQALLGRI